MNRYGADKNRNEADEMEWERTETRRVGMDKNRCKWKWIGFEWNVSEQKRKGYESL